MTTQTLKSILKSNEELLRGKVIQLGKERFTSLKAFGLALLDAERKGLTMRFDTVWNGQDIVNERTTVEAIANALKQPFTQLDICIELTKEEVKNQMLGAIQRFGTSA